MSTANQASRYRIKEELGRGGMAVVYRAYDEVAELDVAVKVLHEHLAGDPEMVEAFGREVELMGSIRDEGIIRVFGRTEVDGRAAIVMQYMEGGELRQRLARRGKLGEEEATGIIIEVLHALAAAHDMGLVHRDIKPQNVLFDAEGRVRLIDFGIGQAEEFVAVEGQVGTVEYMAPERVDGFAVDGRSDLYSVGVMFFEMVCGHLPYRGDSAAAMMRMHREADVPDIRLFAPEVSQRTAAVIQRALAKHPEERFDDAEAMIRALCGEEGSRLEELPPHRIWQRLTSEEDEEVDPMSAAGSEDGREWLIVLEQKGGIGWTDRRDTIQELVFRHSDRLLVSAMSIHGEFSHAQRQDDPIRKNHLARGLSREGAEQLRDELAENDITVIMARRPRRAGGLVKFGDSVAQLFAAIGLAGGFVGLYFLFMLGAMAFEMEPHQRDPWLIPAFLIVSAMTGIFLALAINYQQIAEMWKIRFAQNFLLDFSDDFGWEAGSDTAPAMRQGLVHEEHVELAEKISSPRVRASFVRALNLALHLSDLVTERKIRGREELGRMVTRLTQTGHRLVGEEEVVAALRPGRLVREIRRVEQGIAQAEDPGELEGLTARMAELREQLQARDEAQNRLQRQAQRLLDQATALEKVVDRFRSGEFVGGDRELTTLNFGVDEDEQVQGVSSESSRLFVGAAVKE